MCFRRRRQISSIPLKKSPASASCGASWETGCRERLRNSKRILAVKTQAIPEHLLPAMWRECCVPSDTPVPGRGHFACSIFRVATATGYSRASRCRDPSDSARGTPRKPYQSGQLSPRPACLCARRWARMYPSTAAKWGYSQRVMPLKCPKYSTPKGSRDCFSSADGSP